MRKDFFRFLVVVLLLQSSDAVAQLADTADQQAELHAVSMYLAVIGPNAPLYNGYEYVTSVYRESTNPMFQGAWLTPGELGYDGAVFYDVPLMYDIAHDLVITNRYNMDFRMALISDKVAYFKLLGHTFVRLVADSVTQDQINTGFYDRIYDGKTKAFAKRHKKLLESYQGSQLYVRLEEHDLFFIWKDDKYYSIGSKKALLSAFADHKSELRRYMHKNAIKFRADPELAIMKSAAYYDQIKR